VNVGPISGMQAADLLFDQAGASIANMSAAPDVDLAKQVSDLVLAGVAYDANAKVLQTQDELQRNAVDLIA
jgi:flagellar basal body rod protein FlgG